MFAEPKQETSCVERYETYMIALSVGDEGLLGRKDPRTLFALVHLFILKYPGEYIFCPREICCFFVWLRENIIKSLRRRKEKRGKGEKIRKQWNRGKDKETVEKRKR